MDILLPLLEFLFFAPVLVRLASRSGSRAKAELRQPRAGLYEPGILLHLIGGALLFGATILALVSGEVERGVTPLGAVGAGILLVATALMSWSLTTLTSWRFLPAIDADHELCTLGPYARVRHPIYLAIDLLGLGLVIWVPTAAMILGAVALALGGDLRARAEEKALVESFGDRYIDYAKRVRRTIPRLY